ncbi:MAG TPA: MMPL family transporter [Candidatus Binataceae bacterium]|nr:MMPL family transporter [Candidatus Binataceae bacterium]
MASSSVSFGSFKIGDFVLRYRAIIGAILLIISGVAAYYITQVNIHTEFDDFFPVRHPNVQLYEKWRKYGGAQTLSVMIQVRHGDIFNRDTLQKITDIQTAVDKLPGVDHNQVLSLASYRVSYAEASPGSLLIKPFMFPAPPTDNAGIQDLKRRVLANESTISYLVNPDLKSARVQAAFNERGLDYRELFYEVQDIVKKYQDDNNRIYVAGEPIIRGYGYYYEPEVVVLLLIAVAIMIIILWATGGQRSRWWAPIVTGTLSAVWGLGFVGLMGYDFDPVMLVIPFILTARDMSHGIQWQGRYHDELDRLGDKFAACSATTDFMLPPGFLSIMADISGIIFISFGGIPVLQHIALAGTVWLAGSLTMVFIFQPILMSYLPVPEIKHRRVRAEKGALSAWASRQFDWLVHVPTRGGLLRTVLLGGSALFLVYGIVSGIDSKIGYASAGTPLYKPNAKVNQDIATVGKEFPLEEGWVILTTPAYPNQISVLGGPVLRMMDDFRSYLLGNDPKVLNVVSYAGAIGKPFNERFHYGFPKYLAIPEPLELSANLWFLYLNGSAPGELERFISSRLNDDTCIRILLRDHTYDTLNRIRDEITQFVDERVTPDPVLNPADPKAPRVGVYYLAGLAGLYLAANDVLKKLDFLNITFVLGVVWLFCIGAFRSIVAGVMFLLACVLANFGAFIYMNARGIGLTIDTIPVVSLGIGLGVDYGIYTVSRIRDEVMAGMEVDDAIVLALSTTGVAVFNTFLVMIGGIFPWMFSPLLFHSEMSTLLIFLMATNMVAGCIVLPCYISWARPSFVFGGKAMSRERELKAAVS